MEEEKKGTPVTIDVEPVRISAKAHELGEVETGEEVKEEEEKEEE